MGWQIIKRNPFDTDEQDQLDASLEKLSTPAGEYNPFSAFGEQKVPRRFPGEAASSGLESIADPQQYKEMGKGVVPGAIRFGGTVLEGGATVPAVAQANVQKNAQARLDILDRLDRGEKFQPKFGDLTAAASPADGYGLSQLSPAQRAAERAKLQKQLEGYRPTPLAEQPLYQAGQAVKDYAKGVMPAAEGYENAWGRQLGEGLGSLVAGIPFGALGRLPATIFFGAGGSGEAGERAVEYDKKERAAGRPGLSQEEINAAALWGIGPGTTDLLPIEALLGRFNLPLPQAARTALARGIARIGGQAFVEGVQEGGQAWAQNLIAREGYNPNQALMEGVEGEAAIGAGVGGIAQAARDAGSMALRGFAGRRGGAGASSDTAPVPSDPDQPGGARTVPWWEAARDRWLGKTRAVPLQRVPEAAAPGAQAQPDNEIDFGDLIPADRAQIEAPRRALPYPEEPAPQMGAEPAEPPPAQPSAPLRDPARPSPVTAGIAPTGALPVSAVEAAPVQPAQVVDSFGTTQDAARGVSMPGGAAPEIAPTATNTFGTQDILFALGAAQRPTAERDALGYYSKALESAKALKQNKGTAEQMLAQLEGSGVKNAEIEATGLDRFLLGPEMAQHRRRLLASHNEISALKNELANGKEPPSPERAAQIRAALATAEPALADATRKFTSAMRGIGDNGGPVLNDAGRRPVTKQEIVDYLGRNRVELSESTYGGAVPEEVTQALRTRMEMSQGRIPWDENEYHRLGDLAESFNEGRRDTKWSEYSLDRDNPTYREDVLHLPDTSRGNVKPAPEVMARYQAQWDDLTARIAKLDAEYDRVRYARIPGAVAKIGREREQLSDEREALHAKAVDDTIAESGGRLGGEPYKSGHWPEPNAVAHIRTQLLKTSDGRTSFNLDELQSDWGQKIREGGASDPEKTAELRRKGDEASEWNTSRKVEAKKDLKANAHLLKPKLGEAKPFGETDMGIVNPEGDANWNGRYLVKGVTETPWNLGSLSGKITYWPETFDWKGEPQGQAWIASADNGMFSAAQMRSMEGALEQVGIHIDKINLKGQLQLATTRALNEGDTETARRLNGWVDAINEAEQKANLAYAEWQTAKSSAPGNPLVNTTDQWVTTALRRVIQQAVDSGADGISITPGKVQAERFDLSNLYEDITYQLQDDGQYGLWARRKGVSRAQEIGIYPDAELNGVVGAEIANKIRTGAGEQTGFYGIDKGKMTLGGVDLEIGGEGMKATYDAIYPRTLGKLLQKLDPSIKPEKVRLNPHNYTGRERIPLDELRKGTPFENDFTFFPLTEKAKQAIEEEGQPLFALGASRAKRKAEEPRLAALHNLSAENLAFADRMGGIALPSVAVVKEGMGIDGFGEITLIGRKNLGDPKQNPVFDSDAYTARFPLPDYKKVASGKVQKIIDRFQRHAEMTSDRTTLSNIWDAMVNSPDPQTVVERASSGAATIAAFLDSKGIALPAMEQDAPNVRFGEAKYTNRAALRRVIEADPKLASAFRDWIEDTFISQFGEPTLKVGGKKVDYTLDNIVRAMKGRGVKGQERGTFFTEGSARAGMAQRFSSLTRMREGAETSMKTKAETEKAQEITSKMMENFRAEVAPFYPKGRNVFDPLDAAMRAVSGAASSGKPTSDGLRKALEREEFTNVPEPVIQRGLVALQAFRRAPVPYFESKPQRAVELSEFAGAVIPDNASQQTRDILDKHGVAWKAYSDTDNRVSGQTKAAADFAKELSEQGEETLFALGASAPQTETAAFKRWFGDSKVVGFGGEPKMVYHATLSDFEAFSKGAANPESDMGAGFYFTDTPEDAANNYAHEGGPDIDNRIQRVIEQFSGDEDFYAEVEEANEGKDPDDPDYIDINDRAREAAREALGMAHEGATLPVYLKIENPVVIGSPVKVGGPQEETFFDYESGEVFNEEADDYEYGEPSGKLAEFFTALRDAGEEFDVDPSDMDEIIAGLDEEARDYGGISAGRAIVGVKTDQRLIYASDYDGRLVGSEIVRRALEKMGFDGIMDNTVSEKWGQERRMGGMKGVYPDTIHYIAFKPNQIKSAIGNRGTFDPNDDRIAYALKGFYSPAIRAVEKIKQEKATPDQWWSMITKSPGIRMEELQWMGVKEWLDKQGKDQYGPEERHLFINGDKLSEVFPQIHERMIARGAMDKHNNQVPATVEYIRNKIEAGGYGNLADAASNAADHLSRLSNAEFEFRNTAPIVRPARKVVPKADMLTFMAQHQMELEDKILGGKNPNASNNGWDNDAEIDWDEYEEEIEERSDEIYRELREERDDEAISQWERENDPENFDVVVTPNVGRKAEAYWDNVVMRDYRAALGFFNDWKSIQLALPGIGHAVAAPKLSDFTQNLPEGFWGEDGVPDFTYTLVNTSSGQDIESRDSFDTYEEAKAAAEAHLEKKVDDYDDDLQRARYDIQEEDYHDLQGDARRQARDEIEERVRNEREDTREDEDDDEAADPNDTGAGITEYGGPTQFKKYSIPGGEDYRELLIRLPELSGEYSSWHYKDQELVHLRFDTRYRKGGGEKTMFVHEIQSDLHQRSREFGFGEEGRAKALEAQAAKGWTPEATSEGATVMARREALFQEYSEENWPGPVPEEVKAEIAALNDRVQKLEERATARFNAAGRYISTFGRSGAPEAPYTGNAWWELAFKRAVQYAVEQGFDAISLTNPAQINKASYTPMHVAKQFYGESLPRFINKYLKKWGSQSEKATLSGADDIEYVKPANVTLEQAIDYFRAIGRYYRKLPNMTYFAERMESITNALEITKPQTTEAILQIAEAEGSGRTALREGVPGVVEPLYRSEGANLLWRITDQMRKEINESGQPLALGPSSKSEGELKRQISAFTKLGRSVTVPHGEAMLEVVEPHLDVVPDDTFVAALVKVSPVPGRKGRVLATFKDNNGTFHELENDWSAFAGQRAFFRRGGLNSDSGIFLSRFAAPGSGDKRAIGEVRHESIHALRHSGALDGALWSRLLNHAKNLRILESDLRTYLQSIGSPDYKNAEPGLTILHAYQDVYKGYRSYQESIDQEYVAHMAELYSHGALLPQEIAPVKELLDDIFAGKYSKASGEGHNVGESLQAFAGPWAKTAKQNKLIEAQRLAEANTGPFTIWKQTGWFKAADGRWKFEVDDSKAKLHASSLLRVIGATKPVKVGLGNLLSHPELFKAYPDIADMPVIVVPNMLSGDGAFGAKNTPDREGHNSALPEDYFLIGNKPKPGQAQASEAEMLSALLHEIQHWIQGKEGFSSGGSPATEAYNIETRYRKDQLTEQDYALMQLPEVKAIGNQMVMLVRAINAAEKPSKDMLDAGQFYATRYFDILGFQAYQRIAGEVEAREVQHRQKMGAEERRDAWPSPTPADIQNVRVENDAYRDDMLALAGRRAIGAPKDALAAGERMEGRGKSPEDIWQATGTMRGIEGKQRWEIDDSGAKIIGLDKAFTTPKKAGFLSRVLGRAPKPTPGIKEANNVPLLNVLHHPKLFNAYPFLRQMRVNLAYGDQALKEGALRSREKAGARVYKPIEASGSDPQELLEVLMHEIQHYIQDREGFARGSDFVNVPPTKFAEKSNALYDPGQDLTEEERNDWRNTARSATLLKMTRPESIAMQIIDAYGRLDQAEDPRDREGEERHLKQLGERLEESMLVEGKDYLSSYGEAEAEAVEKRLGMTPEQRRASFPGAGLPKELRDTSSQTRDYNRAYDTVMRRAQVFKDIRTKWAQRKDLGSGVSVVRPDEEQLVYFSGAGDGMVEARTFGDVGGAHVSMWPEFLEKSYPEQKKIMDVAMRDLRSRNMRPSLLGEGATDDEVAFWARYDPRMVAFDPRLYRDRIEEMAQELYGDDATIEVYDTGEVVVSSPEMKRNFEAFREKARAARKSWEELSAKMIEKYGSISDMYQKGDLAEINRYYDLARKADDMPGEDNQEYRYLDLTPIFADRSPNRGRPEGVSSETWEEMMIDEQLAAMGKLPRPGDDVDFSDLVAAL